MSKDDEWFRTFPAILDSECDTFARGGQVAEYAAIALYSKRTGVSLGPALLFFRWDAARSAQVVQP